MVATLSDLEYAVVDLETTGLFPAKHDRVVEIAIVRMSGDGSTTEEFATLVNPGRDVGPTQIHGITARDIIDAPAFSEIIGDVLVRLSGAVVVAHNASFDKGFILSECKRSGVDLPQFPTLCTLRLASILSERASGRSLDACCSHFGITEPAVRHSAADDARACSLLLARCLERASLFGISSLSDLIGDDARFPDRWPIFPSSGKTLRRCEAQKLREFQPHYLARLVTRLMGPTHREVTPAVSAYLALLDRVLEDRLVTECEADSLFSLAQQYHLEGDLVVGAHRFYLEGLARAALADNVVTENEMDDLVEVTRLLGFDRPMLDQVLLECGDKWQAPVVAVETPTLTGKTVCFTGELSGEIDGVRIERQKARELAQAAGLIVADNVTKKLDILVVADPATLSGKAKKAREYGTRIMAEMPFWKAINVKVD